MESQIIGDSRFVNAKTKGDIHIDDIKTPKKNSPATLNEKGLELAEKMGAREIVAKYIDRILLSEDADELEIQQTCFNFAFNLLLTVANAEEKKIIRAEIYEQQGNEPDVLFVFGVLFRDAILARRNLKVPA